MNIAVERKNAVITSATISSADHGVLSAWVFLKFDCGEQGFGGYTLYLPKTYSHHRLESAAGHFIWRVMEIAGVLKWEDLKGKTVRVDATHSKVYGIGHIIKDDWFYPEEDFKEVE